MSPIAKQGTKRIAVSGLWHETNTFAVERNDTMDSVRLSRGQQWIDGAHPKNFVGGFVEGMRRDDIELVPGVSIRFSHGGIIGREIFEKCRAQIIDALQAMGDLDGAYFALHGAMVAEAPYTDAEGELIRAARELLRRRVAHGGDL